MTADLDTRLREYAARWRTEQDEEMSRTVSAMHQALPALPSPRRAPQRRTALAVAASVAAVGVIGAATAVFTHSPARSVVAASAPSTTSQPAQADVPSTSAGLTWTDAGGNVIVAPPAHVLGPVTRARNFPTLGNSLTPPPPSPAPALTAHDAYERCAATLMCPVDSGGPSLSLAVVTTTNSGLRDLPTLAYVLQWDAVPCTGGNNTPRAPGAPATPTTKTTCTWVGLVNATTGQSMGSGQTNVLGG